MIPLAVYLSQSPQSYRDHWCYTEIPLLLSAILGHSESPLDKQRGYIPAAGFDGPLESILRAPRLRKMQAIISVGSDTAARYPQPSCDLSTWGCRRLPFSLFPPPLLISSSGTSTRDPLSAAPRERGASRDGEGKRAEKKWKKGEGGKKKKRRRREKKKGRSSDPPAHTPDCAYLVPDAFCQGAQGGRMNQPRTAGRQRDSPRGAGTDGRTDGETDKRTDGQTDSLPDCRRGRTAPPGNPGGASRGIPAAAAAPEPSPSRRQGWELRGWGIAEFAAFAIETSAGHDKGGLLLF